MVGSAFSQWGKDSQEADGFVTVGRFFNALSGVAAEAPRVWPLDKTETTSGGTRGAAAAAPGAPLKNRLTPS